MKLKIIWGLLLLGPLFFTTACVAPPPKLEKLEITTPKPEEDIPEEMPYQTMSDYGEEDTVTLIYIPHSDGRVDNLVTFLKENPDFRMTVVFPPQYFKPEYRKPFIDEFKLFISSNQIEVGLTLDNEPNLPLLADLDLASAENPDWSVQYSWPADIAEQLARGTGNHKRRWGQLPSGFMPPYFSLSKEVVKAIQRFRMNWFLGHPNNSWGIRYHGPTVLFVSDVQPTPSTQNYTRDDRISSLVSWAMEKPFIVVDANLWERSTTEELFLKKYVETMKGTERKMITAQELAQFIGDENWGLPNDQSIYKTEFPLWTKTNQQERAWGALAEARKTLNNYKNSGRANLRRLDAAMEEILMAESGTFLLALGQTRVPLTLNEKNFIATLGNVYRLTNNPIPPDLKNTFTKRRWNKTSKKSKNGQRGPFFEEGNRKFTWNDPKGDDVGDGNIIYPTGQYPKGSFDLHQFHVGWSDTHVRFTAQMTNIPNKAKTILYPLIDVYFDVNRVNNAGSTTPLENRTNTLIQNGAAWEYALSFGPGTAVLYQSVPGQKPRVVKKLEPHVEGKMIWVRLPLSLVRGDPSQWRFSVGVLASEVNRAAQSNKPIPVLSAASIKSFGGAKVGRNPSPYIDLLAETEKDQTNQLQKYEYGQKPHLPFVEAEN